jgi:hypothetical protein
MSPYNCRVSFVIVLGAFATLALLNSVQPLSAQTLRDELYELNDASKERGDSVATRADLFLEWMATHDWRSLDIVDLYNLYGFINVDAVDRRHFSARWTGALTAPVTGAYTIRQLPVYQGANSRLKVVVNGNPVLDSTNALSDQAVFTSAPIQLSAGQAVPIQVEMVHVVPYINNFSEGAPMVVLTWSRSGGKETIIPSTAFTPPAEFAQPGANGLKGEYFAKASFEDLRVTRLDPALDLVWSWPPAASIHGDESRQVFDACTSKILDGAFLSQSVAEGRDVVLEYDMWRIAYRMTATQREQLVVTIRQRPDVIAAMSPAAVGRLMQAWYMLPNDEHIDLLGEWALARPQPRTEAGEFPGWGDGFYQKLNTDYYWLMGRFMHGPYAGDADTLCDRYLARPNGDCNLAVAYAAAYAYRLNGTIEKFLARLNEHINDNSVQGDKLVTWLIARAFAQGAMPGNPQPLAGFSDLDSAYISAETPDYKFWTLQEMVARLSSHNKADRAKALIQENEGRFKSPDQQQAMAAWVVKADELAARYAEQPAEQAKANKAAYIAELERRRAKAIATGDNASASRYGDLIGSMQSARTE